MAKLKTVPFLKRENREKKKSSTKQTESLESSATSQSQAVGTLQSESEDEAMNVKNEEDEPVPSTSMPEIQKILDWTNEGKVPSNHITDQNNWYRSEI